jgi:phosphate:Na+ symporter
LREAAEQDGPRRQGNQAHARQHLALHDVRKRGEATALYNTLRTEIARILVEIHKLDQEAPETRSSLWLEEERSSRQARQEGDQQARVERLMRKDALSPIAATSFLNDASYAYRAMKDLLEAARIFYSETEGSMAEVERLLSLDEDTADGLRPVIALSCKAML